MNARKETQIMDETITIELPCWNCGDIVPVSLRMFAGAAVYEYCGSCKAGYGITFNDSVLKIDTLSYEG